jgi:TonB family protein
VTKWLAVLPLALALSSASFGQDHKPLTKSQVDDLMVGGLDSERISRAVNERGIDFEPTDEYLSSLRAKGATQALIDALQVGAPTPLKKSSIIHLLTTKTSDDALAAAVKRRGLDSALSEQDLDTLRIAGAGPLLLKALRESSSAIPPPDHQSEGAGAVYDVGVNVTPPIPVHSPDPGYTKEARKAKYSGVATVVAIVNAEGSVEDVQVLKHAGFGLDEKAVAAVRQWKFKPALRNGVPVKVRVNIEVTFRFVTSGR